MATTTNAHNLNILMYSLEEIFGLFDLTYNISVEDLKRAKKKVLMTHPDKSKLPPEYFLFYKKAFDIVMKFYENQTKQNQHVPTENPVYKPTKTTDFNKDTTANVTRAINGMDKDDFRRKFNQLFEENMSTKIDTMKNEWFSNDESIYKIDTDVTTKNMSAVLDKVKQTQSGMVRYRGVENLYVNSNSGTKIYEEDADSDEYITSDPFSKLKFDDLRKVHKEQTVIAVSERDFQNVTKYSSTDHLMRERGRQTLTPLEKHESEQLLAGQEQQFKERMMKKEHESHKKTLQYAEKNKTVMANFLRLGN
jgi:hypothetical protein